jgi:hypothetical protein
MSLYGSGIYGISTYGDSKSIAYNIGFTANTIDYRTVDLAWNVTAVNDADIIYAWKIIKTVGGVPDYPNQGQLATSFVDGAPYAGKKLIDGTYQDIDSLFPSSSIITYSFWGLIGINSTTATWKLLGAADAIIVDNDSDDTTLRILRLLPGAWTSNAAEALGEPDTNTPLYNFVGAFAFYYDKLRAQAGAINNLSDYRKYPKELLPSAVVALGFTYEPKLGDSFHRSLYKNGHLINSLKGTYLGLNNYIKSLTHFKSMISVGRNRMLDYLQSSFEGSVGTWEKVGTSGFTAGSRASNALSNPTLSSSNSSLSDGYGILTKNDITILSLTTNASIVSGTIVDGTTWTITTATAHGFVVGDSGAISGFHPTQFNSTFTVDSVISSTKFTVSSAIDEYSTITATHTSGAAFATITFPSAHGLVSTDQITISGASLPAQFLNTFTVTYVNTTQVTIPIATGTAVITNVAGVAKCLITGGTAAIGNPFLLSYGSPNVTDTTTKTFLVTPGTPYLFSGWALIKSGSTSTITVQAQIQWFDAVGNLLSSATAGSTVNPTAWTKFESSSTYAAIFAPTKAMYAGVKILTANMLATDSLYLDNFMFSVYPGFIGNKEFGSGDAIYEDAKNINISLEGYRTNLISNPGFEDSVGFWNAINGTLLSDTSPITALMAGSTNVCKFTSTASGSSSVYTQWIRNLKPGKEYTFSAYVLAPANGITATANIEWDMPQKLENQTTIVVSTVSGYEGKYRPTVSSKVTSSNTIVNNSSWTRISVTATAPEFTKINGFASAMVSIEFTASAGSEVWYLDCALFEESATVNTYFQGNGGIIPSSSLPPGGSLAPIITDDLIPVGDTAWETRSRSNFLYNPGFETNSTANWFVDAASIIDSFTVGTSSPSPKFGTYRAALAASTPGTYKIGTTFRYPSKVATTTIAAFPLGGERVTGSAYIAHSTDYPLLVTINLTDNSSGKVTSNSFTLPASSFSTVSSWYRVHVTGVLDKPNSLYPSGTLSLSFTPQGPGGTTTYVDGAQVELGNYPTNYVNAQSDIVALGAGISTISNRITAVSKYNLYTNNFDGSTNNNTYLGTPTNVTRATSTTAYFSSLFSNTQSLSLSATATSAVTIPVQAAASPYWSTVVAGRSYTAWGHFSFASGAAVANIQAVINWYNSSGTFISSSSGTATNRPATSTVTGVGTLGSNVITGTSGAFSSVSVGDGVSKAGYIPEGTYVTAVNTTNIVISQNVTTSWASAGVRAWTVPTVTATAPTGAYYATMSFTYTVGASTTVLFLDSVVLRDDSRTQYTTNLVHGLALGDKVTINSISPVGYNATATDILTIDGTNTFTLLNTGVPANRWTDPTVPSYSYVVITNAGTQYATNSILSNIGRSYYWPNIDLKYSRLLNTIANYLPIGSTYTLTKGVPSTPKDENISSIVPSYSFENNLYGWTGLTNNTISCYASAGSKSDVKGFTSASWLIAANTAGSGTIGAQTEFHVNPGTLYQFAANIYAPTSDTATTRTGTPKIQVTWYTNSTKATAIGSTVDVTAEVSSRNAENRWAVLLGQVVAPISSGGAYYAVMSISYTPSSFSGTTSDNIVYIDDVVCVPL